MKQYVDLILRILDEGSTKEDRTGVGTKSIFGHQSVYDLREGFPLLTLKSTHWKSIVHENLWFLQGGTNTKYLNDNGITIWDEWADENGELGPVYGKQWVNWGGIKEAPRIGLLHKREGVWCVKWSDLHSFGEGTHWCYTDISSFNQHKYSDVDEGRKVTFTTTTLGHNPETFAPHIVATVSDNPTVTYSDGINQIQNAIDTLKNNPDDRGNIVSAWNVGELNQMALRPCHAWFQFYTEKIPSIERRKAFREYVRSANIDVSGLTEEDAMKHYGFPERYISIQLYQRSADVFLGVPFNIAGYSLILHMFGKVVNMIPKNFVHTFGDAHLYSNHKEQVNRFLFRAINHDIAGDVSLKEFEKDAFKNGKIPNFYDSPSHFRNEIRNKGSFYGLDLPKLNLPKKDNIFDYKFEDFELIDYNHLGLIKAPVAV